MDVEEAMRLYDSHISETVKSPNVARMYRAAARAFVESCPRALEDIDGDELRRVCEDYLACLPVNGGVKVVTSAVRHFWSMRTGRRWRARTRLSDFERDDSIEAEAEEFGEYLRANAGLASSTVRSQSRVLKAFLYVSFPHGSFTREGVTAEVVRAYVSGALSERSQGTRRTFCGVARSYARFLGLKGHSGAEAIELLPLRPPRWRGADVGPTMSDDDYRLVLGACGDAGCRDPSRLRDRLSVLLMGNLGLRAGDVAGLTMADVDWANGLLHVRHSKSKSERTVPIDAETGRALEAYVLYGRGSGNRAPGDALFLTTGRESGGPQASSKQLVEAVKCAALRAGVASYHGTHSLRRAAATNMVSNGAPLKVVADVLGHEDVKTTMGYLRLDVESLRQACSDWPEGGSQW